MYAFRTSAPNYIGADSLCTNLHGNSMCLFHVPVNLWLRRYALDLLSHCSQHSSSLAMEERGKGRGGSEDGWEEGRKEGRGK